MMMYDILTLKGSEPEWLTHKALHCPSLPNYFRAFDFQVFLLGGRQLCLLFASAGSIDIVSTYLKCAWVNYLIDVCGLEFILGSEWYTPPASSKRICTVHYCECSAVVVDFFLQMIEIYDVKKVKLKYW